jgi:hypothetical protein
MFVYSYLTHPPLDLPLEGGEGWFLPFKGRLGGDGLKVSVRQGSRYVPFIAFDIACFSISTEGTFLSLPDSSWYILQAMPGEFPPGKASLPSIQIEGEPLMFLLTASS